MVVDDQGVAELDAEAEAEAVGLVPQAAAEVDRLLPAGVLLEGAVGDVDPLVAHHLAEQLADPLWPQEGGVELDRRVDPLLLQEELDDLLDLVRRAAVEGREGEGVAEAGREVEVAVAPELLWDLPAQAIDDRRAVADPVDERLDLRRADPRQVVADAHVVEELIIGADLELAGGPQDRDQHRPLDVLL